MKIELPNADAAGNGTQVAPGTVAYPSSDGAANAVQATEDGGARMLTVIDSARAPEQFPYKVDIPGGGHIELADGGTAMVVDGSEGLVLAVQAPWAKDANGVAVPTQFSVSPDGQQLIQTVSHRSANVTYPVTADPSFWRGLGNYLGCIIGVGVPIGAAFVIAALPQSWPFVISWAYQQSAQGGRAMITYVNWVHDRCRAFFRG
ncbi:hypothetical protein VA596_04265 [Amycolatopsis sp., V23-08]|uniref:Uncharacterized protein n=1 Tax=Amycolatopsis heterodermiae TaxID=3110235 RepID=A0ABU5QYS2_9PSEU|nr:hypothetical protein [Amycolatopsis sp., V23-08]MEA5358739.1 hypothetical protein [Amycolatopsis sp., V23-08]